MMPRWGLVFLAVAVCAGQTPVWRDPSPHRVQFVTVEPNVRLEVLDWGGSGPPLVLLAGAGNTAHVFDELAPKLTPLAHVYGITRRGFGASSAPLLGYSGSQLGNDVLAVLEGLRIDRPVIAGHSIAGEEMSSIGTRHPERIAGLIYLDAAYRYAYYDPVLGNLELDSLYLDRALRQLAAESPAISRDQKEFHQLMKDRFAADSPKEELPLVRRLTESVVPKMENDLRAMRTAALRQQLLEKDIPRVKEELWKRQEALRSAPEPPSDPVPAAADIASFAAIHAWAVRVNGFAAPEAELRQQFTVRPNGGIGPQRDTSAIVDLMLDGMQKYGAVRLPILAIYSLPPKHESPDGAEDEAQAAAFEKATPSARVVRLSRADHYLFLSNEADVLREMRAFLDSLR
jgi:non-heme chloroperoxidase